MRSCHLGGIMHWLRLLSVAITGVAGVVHPVVAPAVTAQVSTSCLAAPYGAYSRAPAACKAVALTFDDGPGPSTPQILAILRGKGVTATFFNLGVNASTRPTL